VVAGVDREATESEEQMNAVEFRKLLIKLGACSEALSWSKGKSLKIVWETCERGDWMLWLAGKMIDAKGWPSRQDVVLAACDCVEPALKYVAKDEDRPRKCTDVARRWAEGKASIEELRTARRDADAAASAAYAAAASDAAAAAAYASAAASDASAAAAAAASADADAASDAAYAAASASASDAAASDAAASDAAAATTSRSKSLQKSANLVRLRLKVPL